MKKQIQKTKISICALFAVLTVIFACLSVLFYARDLESRTTPQVKRAIIQVSRLLPQLEENEQAVREVYERLEKKRRLVYKDNQDTLEKQDSSGENAETVIDHTISWMNRVTKLRVGRMGHVVVVSKDDYTILAHPDERFIGEPLYPIGNVDPESFPDISEIDPDNISEDFHMYFPSSFFKEDVSVRRFYAAAEAGVYGTAFSYEDTYILCGTSLLEADSFIIIRSLFTTLFFFSIALVFVCYIGYSLNWRKMADKKFSSNLASYGAFAVIILFAVTWYYETIMDATNDIATMNDHAQVAVETLNTYRSYRKELSDWLDDQYLEQCRLAAELVKGAGKENLTRQEVAEIAKELDVKYIYVFDKKGQTIVTNSPYDHFRISNNEKDQSYAFRPLLDGREYVIQAPMKDESGDEKMQYIGVSLRDENDLADGFVQIAIDPGLRERLLDPINVQTVLDNLVIGLPKYAIAIDKDTMQIVATTGLGYENANISDFGVDVDSIKDNFNGMYLINGKTFYAGVSETEDLYLMPLVKSTDNTNVFFIALKLALFSAAAFFLFFLTAASGYRTILTIKETQVSPDFEEAGTANKYHKKRIFQLFAKSPDREYDTDFDMRWKRQNAIPPDQQTPEMLTGRVIFNLLLVFSVAFILFESYMVNMEIQTNTLDGFSYVILGNWQKGLNLFSFSYCLFLLCVLYVFQEFINQLLYRIARVSSLKNETILFLMKNTLKYACALIFLYIGLAKFGIDTKALWASAGVLSLMIGFGAKDLVNDVIAGLFIIFEGTFKIGDYITVNDWYGTVRSIGIRYTKVSFFNDTKVYNNSSMRDILINDTAVAREIVSIPIPYETDLNEIEKLVKRELPIIGQRLSGLVKAPEYQGLNSFDSSCIMLRIALFSTIEDRLRLRRDLLREFKLLFDREKISIPYNHVVVKEYSLEENSYTYTPLEDYPESEDPE